MTREELRDLLRERKSLEVLMSDGLQSHPDEIEFQEVLKYQIRLNGINSELFDLLFDEIRYLKEENDDRRS